MVKRSPDWWNASRLQGPELLCKCLAEGYCSGLPRGDLELGLVALEALPAELCAGYWFLVGMWAWLSHHLYDLILSHLSVHLNNSVLSYKTTAEETRLTVRSVHRIQIFILLGEPNAKHGLLQSLSMTGWLNLRPASGEHYSNQLILPCTSSCNTPASLLKYLMVKNRVVWDLYAISKIITLHFLVMPNLNTILSL